MDSFKFNVYGKRLLIVPSGDGWKVEYIGEHGKTRPATDIVIPDFISESEIEQYLEDVFHEWATEKHPSVRKIE